MRKLNINGVDWIPVYQQDEFKTEEELRNIFEYRSQSSEKCRKEIIECANWSHASLTSLRHMALCCRTIQNYTTKVQETLLSPNETGSPYGKSVVVIEFDNTPDCCD